MTPPDYLERDELIALGFAAVGDEVLTHRTANIVGPGNLTIGSHVRIDGFTTLACAGAPCAIGDHVHVSSYVALLGGGGFTLGDFSGLSAGTRVFTANDDYSGDHLTGPTVPATWTSVHNARVTVGRHCVIGANSVVLPGVTIGEGAATGALTLVRSDLEPWTLYVGTPARAVRPRSRALLAMEAELRLHEATQLNTDPAD